MARLEAPPGSFPAGSEFPVATVIWLRGEHDVATVPSLSRTFDRVLARDHADLVLDLSGVDFMGAATVGAIVHVREGLRLRSRSLSLRSPSTCAQRIIDLCGLSDMVAKPRCNTAA